MAFENTIFSRLTEWSLLSERESTDGRVGASYPEDPGSSPTTAMLQRALRLCYKKESFKLLFDI